MSHSLRCRLKGLCYKKIITDRECERLCKALDVVDAIEDIRIEIFEEVANNDEGASYGLGIALGIIDKHTK